MNELFWVFAFYVAGSIAFVVIQTMIIISFNKMNQELKKQVEYLKPPF